jgi:hypothetical protein
VSLLTINIIAMKKLSHLSKKQIIQLSVAVAFLVCSFSAKAANPVFSPYFINLSGEVNTANLDDVVPEVVISGNTIHMVWLEYNNAYTEPLSKIYYRRSLDLGKTWEAPQLLLTIHDANNVREGNSVKKLSVEGNNVHICVPDYDYYENGSGRLYYFRSTNNGSSFDAPKEIASTYSGSYQDIYRSFIKSVNNHIGIVYNNGVDGIHFSYSTDNGDHFRDTLIVKKTEYNTDIVDFDYDGNQALILHEYVHYSYGFANGRIYVTTTFDNGETFTTTKISQPYSSGDYTYEKSHTTKQDGSTNFQHYRKKLAKSGDNIYIVYEEEKDGNSCAVLVSSNDNGRTFNLPIRLEDTNSPGTCGSTVEAKENHVYIATKKNGYAYLKVSDDGGNTFTPATDYFTTGFYNYIYKPWLFYLMIDPNDPTGKTVHLVGNTHFLGTSYDGGHSFSKVINYTNCFNNFSMGTQVLIDSYNVKHWFLIHNPFGGTDTDIYYRQTGSESAPGNENQYFSAVEPQSNYNKISLGVGHSPSLNFDSAMTAELWVKFYPEKTSDAPLLLKLKESWFYDYNPYGYDIAYRNNSGTIAMNCGLQTDKGNFVNWCPAEINDTLWHHVVFTYDANAGLNNFITYVDGVVKAQQTVTGKIDAGEGMLKLGPGIGNNYYHDLAYKIDEVRLWNTALTQSQLQQNMTRTNFEGENHLKMYLNFNGTFKDMSGNDNDGIPMAFADLLPSDFNPPLTNFELYKVLNEVSLNNKTVNGKEFKWNFGNGQSSDVMNPKYTYPDAGEFQITLTGKNENSVTTMSQNVSIQGLDHFEPTSAGNSGWVTLQIYGGGLSPEGTQILLRKSENPDLAGDTIVEVAPGVLRTRIPVDSVATGNWEVIVKNGATEQKFPQPFVVQQTLNPQPWVSFDGRGAILFNRWQTYTLNFGNNGNVDTYGVPVWFAITDDPNLEIEFIDFKMDVPQMAIDKGIATEIKNIGEYFTTDTVFKNHAMARVYPFMLPVIKANSSGAIHIRVKSPKTFDTRVWMNPSWLEKVPEIHYTIARVNKERQNAPAITSDGLAAAECMVKVLGTGVIDIGTSAIPGVGCVWSAGKYAYSLTDKSSYKDKWAIGNTLWNGAVTFVDCGINLSGVGGIIKGVGVFLANMRGYANDFADCNHFRRDSEQNRNINAVSSFDPNEMIGPNGTGKENWIQNLNEIPYTVLFENKSTATAPAHTVVVTDTLDLNTFDLKNFSFGNFGWGDSIFSPIGTNLKEFSRDIDMRPGKNLIARVSAKVDTLTGIVKWEFLSLTPETLQEEEDPFLGFLPPNVNSPEGEGFVSFSVGLKETLASHHRIANQATIKFDENTPILTNVFENILDKDVPESQVTGLTPKMGGKIWVEWSGADNSSGIKHYSVFVQKDDEEIKPWVLDTIATNAEFTAAEKGSTYKFYSICMDSVGYRENVPGDFDAQLVFTSVIDVSNMDDKWIIYPNPAKDILHIHLSTNLLNFENYVVELYSLTGQQYKIGTYNTSQVKDGISIPINNLPSGNYLIRIVYNSTNFSQKIEIR